MKKGYYTCSPLQRAQDISSNITKPCRLKKSIFTLTELLVVIATIAILGSMLMPSLKAAKDMAKQTQCLNSMKQLGTMSELYVNDYGYLPAWTYSTDGSWMTRYWYWHSGFATLGYIGRNSINLGWTGTSPVTRSEYACPEATVQNAYSLALNMNFYENQALSGPSFTYPSRLAYIADGNSMVFDRLYYPVMATGAYSVNLRHQDKNSFNVIYTDLHGDTRSQSSVKQTSTSGYPIAYTPFWWTGPTYIDYSISNNAWVSYAPAD